ncbi:S2-RNase [Pyrus ussuriensis x Pyrus communis]|uniref:S2-RNase n=1 Tax=Pyrus ussuriensis x Pyrus communis TaxID=2448454 RepID=A0A5N5FAV1_9ROSA|nr:S2-RNase [Pyrus ussuriensis x Pyrus communis]
MNKVEMHVKCKGKAEIVMESHGMDVFCVSENGCGFNLKMGEHVQGKDVNDYGGMWLK